MGSLMAANLARAGYPVTVWNRTTPSTGTDHAGSAGCTIATRIEDALDGSQVVCSCVTDAAAIRDTILSERLNLQSLLGQDAVVVDCSTIGPVQALSIAEELSSRGVRFVDAPVTGGDVGARNGTLTFMVGAADRDLAMIRPLLEVMGGNIVHAGPVGSGQSLKLVNQLLCGINLLAVVEAFQVAERLGMDRSLVVDACGGGAAGSWQLVNLGPKIIEQDHAPGFRARDLLKDLRFLRDTLPAGSIPKDLPCLAQALASFEKFCRTENGELGTQAVWMSHPA